MRTYAQAMLCPDCGAPRVPGPRCAHCGLLLQGPLADQLWGLLTATDSILATMRAERDAASQPAPAAPAGPTTPPPARPQLPPEVAAQPARRQVSVAAILLALGALLVVVAAFVFVAVTWGQLSLATRALVLLAITALAATVATLISRRGLRASAEAAWAVALGMLALDVAAARGAGLLGLDRPSETAYLFGAGVLFTIVGSGVAIALRRPLGLALVVPQLVSVGGLAIAASAALDAWDARLAWQMLAAAAVAALVTAGHRVLNLPLVTAVAAAATAIFAAAQVLSAELDALEAERWRAAWGNGRAWPSVASVLLLLAVGWAISRWPQQTRSEADSTSLRPGQPHSALPGLLVSVAAFAAAGIVLTWLLTPSLAAVNGRGDALLFAAAAGGLALVSTPFADAWGRGLRTLAAGIGLASFLGCLDDVAAAALALVTTALPVWQQPVDVRLDAVDVGGPPLWTAVLQLAVAAGSLLLAARVWRLPSGGPAAVWLRAVGPPVAIALAASACLLPVVALRTPVAVVCAAAVLAGAVASGALVLAAGLPGRVRLGLGCVGVLLLGLASYEALASPVLSAFTWAAVSLVLFCVGGRLTAPATPALEPVGAVAAALAGGLTVASILATGEALDLERRTTVLLVVSAALALTALATLLRRRRGLRTGLEVAALVAGVVAVAGGLAVMVDEGPAFLAVVLTLLGGAAALLALLVPDRRRVAPGGAALLAVAWWLRLVASEVETVEAYTLPVAAPLLLAGLWAMHRRPGTRSVAALLPGLLLATAPSLPAALAAPASPRGLLLGLAALVLVGIGARLAWVAPFAVGVVVAVLLALRHLTPLADGLPRWVILAAAGLLLLAAGTTWESRAREARRGLAAVRAMR